MNVLTNQKRYVSLLLIAFIVMSIWAWPVVMGDATDQMGDTVPGRFTSDGFTEPIVFESTGGESNGGHLILTQNLTGTAVTSGGAITPQVPYRLAFDVARSNGLNTAASITVKMFYEPDHASMSNAEIEKAFQAITQTSLDAFVTRIDFNASSAATFTHVSTGALTTWALLTSSAVSPGAASADAHTQAAVNVDFVPSKVAREDTLGDWVVMVELNDISNDEPIRTYDRIESLTMQWYGEITVPTGAALDFGTINVNDLTNDDTDYIQLKATSDTGIRFIANGAYIHTLKADETWTSPKGPARLNTEAANNVNLTAQGFALRGNVFEGVRDLNLRTVQLKGESQDFYPRFTRSDETGNIEDLYLHLRIHPEFQNAVYTGKVTFGIAPYAARSTLNSTSSAFVEAGGLPVSSVDDFTAMDDPFTVIDGQAYAIFGQGTAYERIYPVHSTSSFIQTNDLDLSALSSPLFTQSAFTGQFHGQGYMITGVSLNVTDGPAGLFATAENAVFTQMIISDSAIMQTGSAIHPAGMIVGKATNITMESIILSDSVFVHGQERVGGLIGWIDEETVSDGQVTAIVRSTISAHVSGDDNVGGLVGEIDGGSTIEENVMDGMVFLTDSNTPLPPGSPFPLSFRNVGVTREPEKFAIGGFIGDVTLNTNETFKLADNVNVGTVTGTGATTAYVGGFIGALTGNNWDNFNKVTIDRNIHSGTLPDSQYNPVAGNASDLENVNEDSDADEPRILVKGDAVSPDIDPVTLSALGFDLENKWVINNRDPNQDNWILGLRSQGIEPFDLRIRLDGPSGPFEESDETFVLNAYVGEKHPYAFEQYTLTLSSPAISEPIVRTVTDPAIKENLNLAMGTLKNGDYTYTVVLTDANGNTRSAIQSFTVAKELPILERMGSTNYIGQAYVDVYISKPVDVAPDLVLNQDITVRYLDSSNTSSDGNPFNATIVSIQSNIVNSTTRLRLFLENPIFTGPVANSSFDRSGDGHFTNGFDHTQAFINSRGSFDNTYRNWIESSRYEIEVQITNSAIDKFIYVKSGETLVSGGSVSNPVAREALPEVLLADYTNSGTSWDYGPSYGRFSTGSCWYGFYGQAKTNFWLDEVVVRATPGTIIDARIFEVDWYGRKEDGGWLYRKRETSVSDEIYTRIDIRSRYLRRGDSFAVAVQINEYSPANSYIYRMPGYEDRFREQNNPNGWDMGDIPFFNLLNDFGNYYGGNFRCGHEPGDFNDSFYLPDIGINR